MVVLVGRLVLGQDLVNVGVKEFVILGLGACLATGRPRHSDTDLEH